MKYSQTFIIIDDEYENQYTFSERIKNILVANINLNHTTYMCSCTHLLATN